MRALEELPDSTQFLVASGSLPPGAPDDFYAEVTKRAGAKGIKVIVDTSGDALRKAANVGVYLLKPNLRELSALAGKEEVEHEEQQEAIARDLIGKGCVEVLVVSLGAGGVMLVTKDSVRRFRSPSVPIKSKVGAGDSTVGGIVTALARGESIEGAVCYGVAAGAAAVMTPGTELCRKEDVEMLYERMGRCM